jgi:leucyl/phenylalanyl-tRNA--protein transferase
VLPDDNARKTRVSALLSAYRSGLFPMGEARESPEIYWVNPDFRGIIPLNQVAPVRSLRRALRGNSYVVTVDINFRRVIEMCAEITPSRPESWINSEIIKWYTDLHAEGYAHSVECWKNNYLVGGLYGVSIGAAFFGESMFSRETNASKVALAHLVQRLIKGGYTLLDVQFVTAHLSRLGAIEVSRAEYLEFLDGALRKTADFHSMTSTGGKDSISTSG